MSLAGRERRPLPVGLGAAPASPDDPLVERWEVPWLQPVPDAAVLPVDGDPAQVVAGRHSMRLALVAALQHRPARQRAVLVLRDVLTWSAAEVAAALETSTAAVNSALQRARAQLAVAGLDEDAVTEPTDARQRALLDRYARAIEQKDVTALVDMFTAEARWEMPPFLAWYRGPQDIARLVAVQCPAGPGELRMVPTAANGQPAFGMYMVQGDGDFHPFQLQVLQLSAGRLGHVTAFFDRALFPLFGLPDWLPARRVRA